MLKVKIDRQEPTELFEQVAAEIRRAIADGEAKPGERLPPAARSRAGGSRSPGFALPSAIARRISAATCSKSSVGSCRSILTFSIVLLILSPNARATKATFARRGR